MRSIDWRKTLWMELLKQALVSLRDNRLRTILSITGIAIGVMSVIIIGTVSQEGRRLIFSELETFGLRSVWIFRDFDHIDPRRAARVGTGIKNDDIDEILAGCCPAVESVTPVVRGAQRRHQVNFGNNYSNAGVDGVSEAYFEINNDVFTAGRAMRREDVLKKRQIAVIGPDVGTSLFGDALQAVGRSIRIDGKKFLIVGVMDAKDRGFLASIGSAGGEDANSRVLVPYTTYQNQFGIKEVSFLQLQTVHFDQADEAVTQVTDLLQRRHADRYAYKSESMAQYIQTANRILGGVSIIGLVAASISLVVGGMGIANIMSTSVLERTREIGVRMAIGARRFDILLQFLLESVVISVIGGAVGLFFGLSASLIIAYETGSPTSVSGVAVMVAMFVSICVGLISGIFPARRAAMMQPVAALRYE